MLTFGREVLAACNGDVEQAARRLAGAGTDLTMSVLSGTDGEAPGLAQPLVELEILVDGTPLPMQSGQAECCRVRHNLMISYQQNDDLYA